MYVNPVTNEKEPFFVKTNRRTEHFATKEAAQAFMETHCIPWSYMEHIVETNAIN